MNDIIILDTIISEGLAVRRIPDFVTEKYDYNNYVRIHKTPGEHQVEIWKPTIEYFVNAHNPERAFEQFYKNFPEGRKWLIRKKVPKHAGYWMCKKCNHTSSSVEWNMSKDNTAPTLQESVQLYLKNKK